MPIITRVIITRVIGAAAIAAQLLLFACHSREVPTHERPLPTKAPNAEGPMTSAAASSAAASSPVTLHATFAVVDRRLQVDAELINAGRAPILVFDRLWTLDAGKAVADHEPAYRFVRDGKLQLLLGVAPLPTLMLPTFRNVTEATQVEAGGRLRKKLEVIVPVQEYNVYFDAPPSDAVATAKTTSVELLVEYVEATGVATKPSVSLPGALSVETPEAVEQRKLARSAVALELEVLVRSDDFERPF